MGERVLTFQRELHTQADKMQTLSDLVNSQIASQQNEISALREGIESLRSSGAPCSELQTLRTKLDALGHMSVTPKAAVPAVGHGDMLETPRTQQVGEMKRDIDSQKRLVGKQLREMESWC